MEDECIRDVRCQITEHRLTPISTRDKEKMRSLPIYKNKNVNDTACPCNATLQASSIYFKTLNKRLCHVLEHVRKCMKIYCFIQEIIFVSLRKPSALIPNCHTLRSNFFFPTSNPRFQVFSKMSQMAFLSAKEPTMVLSFTLRYSQNNT
jgi:hypothetical protein